MRNTIKNTFIGILYMTDLNIPKNIFQTHKSIDFVNSNSTYKKCMNSWIQHSSAKLGNYRYFFYDNEMCDEFIKTNFEEDVYQAYSRLPMAVMKADLWRYCIIYTYGGIYADADAMCLVNPDLFTAAKTLLVCGPENSTHLCQWFFAAPKKSPLLKSIIELSVKRILEISEIKGEHIIHYLTGPGCFTDGIEEFLKTNNKSTFNDRTLYDRYRNETMCVFNYKIYHTKIIRHFFTGLQPGGWTQERNEKLR
jgi:mannosyltransferase OCH1-like enzyme